MYWECILSSLDRTCNANEHQYYKNPKADWSFFFGRNALCLVKVPQFRAPRRFIHIVSCLGRNRTTCWRSLKQAYNMPAFSLFHFKKTGFFHLRFLEPSNFCSLFSSPSSSSFRAPTSVCANKVNVPCFRNKHCS